MKDKVSAYNRVLGNPAKNHYNLAIQIAQQAKDRRVKAIIDAGGQATANYTSLHGKGLMGMVKHIFPNKAYTAQRTWLQLTVRKPLEMTI